jgi:hypothetical protein
VEDKEVRDEFSRYGGTWQQSSGAKSGYVPARFNVSPKSKQLRFEGVQLFCVLCVYLCRCICQ